MNTELFTRISHIKQYINTLSEHISTNHPNTGNVISKFKKAVMKEDPHQHPNQFLLDCLKTKNEKLLADLQQLQLQKKVLQSKINENRTNNKNMKDVQVGIFITRLTVSLNEVKKVQYDDVSIACNYQLLIINSLVGNKYKNYPLAVESIINLENKGTFVHVQYQDTQKLNILVRFQQEKDLLRWTTSIKFGILIQTSKKKDKLFQVKKEETPPPSPPPTPAASPPNVSINHIPPLTFKQHQPSPSQSEKSMNQSFNDKMEKNTERQLVNALSADRNADKKKFMFERDDRSSRQETFGKDLVMSKEAGMAAPVHKYQQNRPPNPIRVRGLSQNIQHNVESSKILNKINNPQRKHSEDNWKPQINQAYHNKMLETLRMREANDEDKSESGPSRKLSSLSHNKIEPKKEGDERSNKQKSLEEKKKELLSKSSPLKPETPGFLTDSKVSWQGIEENEDENKSKSSRYSKDAKSRRESMMTESIGGGSNGSREQKKEDDRSEHITQKSEQQSPKFPKSVSPILEIPQKISYSDGTVFRLLPVEKNKIPVAQAEIPATTSPHFSTNYPATFGRQERQEKKSEEDSKQSEQSSSEEHEQSDPSSHANHTETEDYEIKANELKNGINLTKCSKDGFWSHEKTVLLQQNEKYLVMRDLSDKKVKKIPILNIEVIQYKKYGDGIKRHISKIIDENCLTIRAKTEDGKSKDFQFYTINSEGLEMFYITLQAFWDTYKKKYGTVS